jgi:RNA polymerase-binding transcription factor
MDPERARERLSEERRRIEQELSSLGGTRSSDETQEADKAAELDQAERDEAIREELMETLSAIERAEQRLEDGGYGVSIVSGDPIPDERLEAIPWAERNVGEPGA